MTDLGLIGTGVGPSPFRHPKVRRKGNKDLPILQKPYPKKLATSGNIPPLAVINAIYSMGIAKKLF